MVAGNHLAFACLNNCGDYLKPKDMAYLTSSSPNVLILKCRTTARVIQCAIRNRAYPKTGIQVIGGFGYTDYAVVAEVSGANKWGVGHASYL
jgi:hypothetical protein